MSIFKFNEPLSIRNEFILNYLNKNEFFIVLGKTSSWDDTWGDNTNDSNPPLPSLYLDKIPEPFIYKRCEVVNPIIESSCKAGDLSFNECDKFELNGKIWIEIDYKNEEFIRSLEYKIRNYIVKVDITELELVGINKFRALGLLINPILEEGVSSNLITYRVDQIKEAGQLKLVSFFTPITNNGQIINFSFIDSI